MTKGGDEKNRIGDECGERPREQEREREKERHRERPNGIFGKWNEEIKEFSLIGPQQITDLFDRV